MGNFRQEIELLQNYQKHKTFTFTTSSSSAETALDIAATTTTMLIPQAEGYSDSGIYAVDKLSVIRSSSTNVRVRGIAWGR